MLYTSILLVKSSKDFLLGVLVIEEKNFLDLINLRKLHQGVRKSFLSWLKVVTKFVRLVLGIEIIKILDSIKILRDAKILELDIIVLRLKIN